MITAPKHSNAHLPSSWAAAMCILVLGVGGYGASLPVMPVQDDEITVFDIGDDSVIMEEFEPPPPGPAEAPVEEMQEDLPIEEEMEIEEPPEIQAPLTPPEMPELTALEEIKPPPPKPQLPKPKPPENKPKPKPVLTRRSTGTPTTGSTPGTGSGEGGGTNPQGKVGGRGKGRFPQPGYPAAARAAGMQGTVRLLVIVEASGLPGSVSVQSSSGYALLDNAARDQVSRRWRWPTGESRRFVVPVRFVLRQ